MTDTMILFVDCGCYVVAPGGKTYPSDTPRRVPVGVGYGLGKSKASG